MTLVIGTDEAGYGPNLGPLVVGASLWRIADREGRAPDVEDAAVRLAALAGAVAADAGGGRPPWGDSKSLFTPGGGVGALERGVLGALAACGPLPRDGAALVSRLSAGPSGAAPEWPGLLATPLPVAAEHADIARIAAAVAARGPETGIGLLAVAARVVMPDAFNAALDAGLNKSDILSRATLDLAAGLRARAADEPALVWCDRHGGRKAYAALVGRHFDAVLVRTLEETSRRSRYRSDGGTALTEVEFAVGGEARLPVALASMTAKYLRELFMDAFNRHWGAVSPGLGPTAGYPLDARRWRDEAEAAIRAAGMPADALWRRA